MSENTSSNKVSLHDAPITVLGLGHVGSLTSLQPKKSWDGIQSPRLKKASLGRSLISRPCCGRVRKTRRRSWLRAEPVRIFPGPVNA